MRVQNVNNKQSFTATLKYERPITKRLRDLVGEKTSITPEDEFGIKAENALEMLKYWLINKVPQKVFGIKKEDRFIMNVYNEPIACQIDEDIIVLDESKSPQNYNFPSVIRILFGKDASEETVRIERNTLGSSDRHFDEVADLIKAVK